MEVAFLSGGRGGATEVRAEQLGIRHCLVGARDKPAALAVLQAQLDLAREDTLFLGDDLNDLSVRLRVGLLVATADAVPALRRHADLVLSTDRGAMGRCGSWPTGGWWAQPWRATSNAPAGAITTTD